MPTRSARSTSASPRSSTASSSMAAGLPLVLKPAPQREITPMNADRIPATIVTGFLGAGKTTLIRNLIARARGRRIAIIVNEFGEMGFDGSLLADCGDDDCRPDHDRRAHQWLHLLHRRGRVPSDHRGAARPRSGARPHRHRDVGPRPAAAARPRLRVAERPPSRHRRRRRHRRRCAGGCARAASRPTRRSPTGAEP